MSVDDLRLDLLAVIVTEAPAAAAGDAKAWDAVLDAADDLFGLREGLDVRPWNLGPKYAEARAALTPNLDTSYGCSVCARHAAEVTR